MKMRTLLVASAALVPGCAFPQRSVTLVSRAEKGHFAGKRVRVTLGTPGSDLNRAVTLRVVRFEYPYLFGEIEREEVQTSGIWTEVPSRLAGTDERFDIREAERVEVLQTNGQIGAGTCLASGAFLVGLFVAALARSFTGGGTQSGRRFWRGDVSVVPSTFSVPGRRPARHAGSNQREADALASAWIHAARAEAASVPAFERMAEEFHLVGAPGALADGARRSAEEEVGHARLAFAEGERWSGRAWGALPLEASPRWTKSSRAAIARLAREAWFDGCLGEAGAAEVARAASRLATDAETSRLHARIASEEEGHAELAWSFLEWAWREGDPVVRDSIVAASQEPDPAPSATETSAIDLEWLAAHGHPSPAIDLPRVQERAHARLRALVAG